MKDQTDNPLHVSRSAERALTLLDLIATEGSMTLGAAAAATDIPTSTALRHLRALTASGWLRRDPSGEFAAGPTLLRIALRAFRAGPFARLVATGQPYLESLARQTGESAYLAIRDGRSAVYLSVVESSRAIRHVGWVGKEVPINGSALGTALTSAPGQPGDVPPIELSTGAIEADVAAVTVPIYDNLGVAAAFSILGPKDRLTKSAQADIGKALQTAAVEMSLELAAPIEP